jgi:predicted ATPase
VALQQLGDGTFELSKALVHFEHLIAYALERLNESGELELMNKRHYDYYVGFSARNSARTGPKYEGPAPGIVETKWWWRWSRPA